MAHEADEAGFSGIDPRDMGNFLDGDFDPNASAPYVPPRKPDRTWPPVRELIPPGGSPAPGPLSPSWDEWAPSTAPSVNGTNKGR